MANYQELFRLPADLYQQSCPIMLKVGVLQKETESGTIFAQLKFKNISEQSIKSVKVIIRGYGPNGAETQDDTKFYYLDLDEKCDNDFGQTTPVVLNNPIIRKISVCIAEVVQANGDIWVSEKFLEESLPKLVEKPYSDNIELSNAYTKVLGGDYNKSSVIYLGTYTNGVYQCTCGRYTFPKPDRCPICHRKSDIVLACSTEIGLKEQYYLSLIDDYNRLCKSSEKTNATAEQLDDLAVKFDKCGEYKEAKKYAEKCRQTKINVCVQYYQQLFNNEKAAMTSDSCASFLLRFQTAVGKSDDKRVQDFIKSIESTMDSLIAKEKKRRKATAVVSSVIVAAVAVTLLLIYAIIPSIKYSVATKHLEAKEYDAAVTVFTELGDFKDAHEMVIESKYRKAVDLYKNKKYKNAYKFLKSEFSDNSYKKSDEYIQKSAYGYASELGKDKKYDEALTLLTDDGDSKDKKVKSKLNELYYLNGKRYLDEKKYYSAYSNLKKVDKKYKSDVTSLLKKAAYGQGCDELASKSYSLAISSFKNAGDYKDTSTKVKEAKYQYIKANYNNKDESTFKYLKELRSARYKDSASLYKKLYSWKVKLTCFNEDSDDYTTIQSHFSRKTSYVHFAFEVSGGYPGEATDFYHMQKYPDGTKEKSSWYWESQRDGDSLGCAWYTGWYFYSGSSDIGTQVIEIYTSKGEYVGGCKFVVEDKL